MLLRRPRQGRANSLLRTPFGDGSPVFEVLTAAAHEGGERVEILGNHRGPQLLDRLRKRLERLRTVVVEALDLEIQLRTFLRDERSHVELRIEGGRRQLRQARRSFAAFRQRSEERDIQGVRQAKY